jgi:hypothetical protein
VNYGINLFKLRRPVEKPRQMLAAGIADESIEESSWAGAFF